MTSSDIDNGPASRRRGWLVAASLLATFVVLLASRALVAAPVKPAEAERPQGLLPLAAALGAALAGLGFGLWQRQRRIVRQLATEGERRLGELVQGADDAVFVLAPDGRVLQASRRAETMYGYSPDELRRLTLSDLRAGSAREGVRRTLSAALAGDPVTQEAVHRRRDGTEFPVEVSTRRVTAHGEVYLIDIARDITDRRRAEEALRDSEARYRALVESASSAIIRWRADATVSFANEYALRLFGYAADELVGQPVSVLVPGSDSTGADLSGLVRAIAEVPEEFALSVNENVCKDGRRVWMAWTNRPVRDAGGRLIEILTVGSDITKLKETEDALRESEEKLRLFVEHAPAALAMFDREMRYLAASRRWHTDYGLEHGALLGRSHYEVFPEIPERWKEVHRRGLAGEVIRDDDDSFDRRDGTTQWQRWEVRPWRTAAGAVGGIVIFSEDVTESKRAEAEIRRLNADLEERVARRTEELQAANRELEAFAYSVSHDLRVPLRAVDGFSRLLAEEHGAGLDAEGRRLAGVVREQTARMGQLIDDLLAFSRVGRAEMRTGVVDMRALAGAAFADLGGGARGAELTLGPLPAAHGDAALLRQVWLNLLGNALKFCPADRTPIVEVSGGVSDGELVYTVSDHGVGFDMRYVAKLFGVFQRLHSVREFPGTGVGLALVQRIVHRHGGRVWAESAPGGGAAFSFALPAPPREE